MIAVLSSQIEKASKPKKPKATKVVGRGHGFKGSHDIEIAAGDGDQEAEAQIAFVKSPDLVRSPDLQPGPHFKDTNAQKWHLFVMKLQEQSRLSLLGCGCKYGHKNIETKTVQSRSVVGFNSAKFLTPEPNFSWIKLRISGKGS